MIILANTGHSSIFIYPSNNYFVLIAYFNLATYPNITHSLLNTCTLLSSTKRIKFTDSIQSNNKICIFVLIIDIV